MLLLYLTLRIRTRMPTPQHVSYEYQQLKHVSFLHLFPTKGLTLIICNAMVVVKISKNQCFLIKSIIEGTICNTDKHFFISLNILEIFDSSQYICNTI